MSEAHLGGAYPEGDANTIMHDVWGYLLVKYEIKSMLDIGCGYGHTMKWFSNFLCNVHGVDGWDEAVKNSVVPGAIEQWDFTKGPFPHGIPYDLIWAAEFLEHVEEKFIPHVMPSFRLGRYACVTHGEPGQHGHNHVNCQSSGYWIAKFNEYGFDHDATETALLRRTDRWRAMWGRRTLMFFIRR